MALDPFTLLVVLTVTHTISAVIFFIVWLANKDVPGVGLWAAGRTAIVVALLVFVLRPVIPTPVSVLLGNASLVTGLYLVWQGNLAFTGRRRPPWRLLAGVLSVILTLEVYWTIVVPDFAMRSVLSSGFIIAFDVLAMHAILPRKGEEMYFAAKLLAASFGFSALSHIWRIALAVSGMGGIELLEPSQSTQLALITATVIVTMTAMANMAIIMEYLRKDLKHLAERDSLTGAFNRRAFYAVAEHVLARAQRESGDVSLLALDLDRFKTINDTFGHMAGDEVLKRVADVLHRALRHQDVLVRLGGEEFAMLLPATSSQKAYAVAERVRKEVESLTFDFADQTVQITTSLGVSTCAGMDCGVGIEALIHTADLALYQAKKQGRNQVCLNDEDLVAVDVPV